MHGPVTSLVRNGAAAGSADDERIEPRQFADLVSIDDARRERDAFGHLRRQARLLRDEWRRRRYARLLDR